MDMRVPSSVRVIGFCLAAVVATAGYARATDYFALDLRHAEFSPEPLGPSAQFAPPAPASIPVATVPEVAPSVQTAAATPRRVNATRVRIAAHRPHRNPLNALASYPRPRDHACTGGGICVFDGATGRWHAR